MAALDSSFLTDPWPDPDIAEAERYEERAAYWSIPADPEYAASLRGQREANLRALQRMRGTT
jgi:hypothetical protein